MYNFRSKLSHLASLLGALLVLCLLSVLPNVIHDTSSAMIQMAWAQEIGDEANLQSADEEVDEDPLVKAQEFIDQGKRSIKTASSRSNRGRSRARVKRRVNNYFAALRSFSSALRILDEYEMEEEAPEYYTQIKELMGQVVTRKEVKTKLDRIEGDLVKAVKSGAYDKARGLAQKLISLDERNKKVRYLLPILNDLLSDQ